ncbi:uncharacterized protein LOC112590199 [Harpegnathos saltator]|uniref:uncharacterized protein LOC112590199 n=1 Tax=Harpegnathos saltator TaxID=610380 RepID=UPI000DBED124|nr:uncharacterized protein LOC112590199 [Harpegnathos saltator]
MLRQLIVPLILGGLIASCLCEPVDRRYQLRAASSRSIECVHDEGDRASGGCAETDRETTEDRTRTVRTTARRSLSDIEDSGLVEVTGRKRKNRGNRIILYILGAMKAMLIYGLLHGVATLAGKAVVVAKIALAIAIAAILKKNDQETSYEVVKYPHHSYIQTHSSSVDYDHRNDYGEDGYSHREGRRILR